MQMLPREVILALVLVDLPIHLDNDSDTSTREGFGSSWGYLTCECDDHYVGIVEEVVSLCSFAQVRTLCFLKVSATDVLLSRATPKCKNLLSRALRFMGRFEFVESSPTYSDEEVEVYNAMDYGTSLDPIVNGRKVLLQSFHSKSAFLRETALIKDFVVDANSFEEIMTFNISTKEFDKSPLSRSNQQGLLVAIERPDLTLSGVVRGMLGNKDCQHDPEIRRRYGVKVLSVLRVIAKSLRRLHAKDLVHGNVCLENCGKFEDQWKLSDILGAQRVGALFPISRLSSSAPPEAVEPVRTDVSEHHALFRNDLPASTSIDSWGFGKLAYEVLVGDSLLDYDTTKSVEEDHKLIDSLLHWSEFNVLDARHKLLQAGIPESGVALLAACLSPDCNDRPSMGVILKHPLWEELRQSVSRLDSSPNKQRRQEV